MTDTAETNRAAGDAAGVVDEFAHIPHSRGRHPVVAVAGALLAFFLVFHIRHDLRYALSSGEPLDLGRASAVFGHSQAVNGLENRYVRVAGLPDRESALQIDTKGSWVFSQLFRVLGTGDRLFLHRRESPLPAALAESDVFEGRLIRVDDLSFAASIRSYFSTHVAATHFFAPDALARALAGRHPGAPLSLVDTSGDTVALDERETIAVDVAEPDQVRIGLPRDRFVTEDDARAALTSRGGEVVRTLGAIKAKAAAAAPESGPLSSTPEPAQRWTFVVKFPPAVGAGGARRHRKPRPGRRDPRRPPDDRGQAGGRVALRRSPAASSFAPARGRPGRWRRPRSPPSTPWRRWSSPTTPTCWSRATARASTRRRSSSRSSW